MSFIDIPNKKYFLSNEVCGLTGVKPYVLRFWETEFEDISPEVDGAGIKLYKVKDVEAIVLIKKLLFEEKMTIERAKMQLRLLRSQSENMSEPLATAPQEENIVFTQDHEHREEEILELTSPPIEFFEEALEDDQSMQEQIKIDYSGLLTAKQKLSEIISIAQELKSRSHWAN